MRGDESKTIKLYWWQQDDSSMKNVGDELSPLMVEEASGRSVERASLEECDLMAIGSILERAVKTERDLPVWVWGSGFIKRNDRPQKRGRTLQRKGRMLRQRGRTLQRRGQRQRGRMLVQKGHKQQQRGRVLLQGRRNLQPPMLRFAAVRGPLSAKQLAAEARPQALGDPAVLADRLLKKPVQTRWEIGIVPHYVDLAHPLVEKLGEFSSEAAVISPMLSPVDFVEKIAACRTVISSSLHGLVVADALGVPNKWVEFSDQILGGGFKYRDYLANFEIADRKPQSIVKANDIDSSFVRLILSDYHRPGIEQMKKDLVAAFPQT